VIDFGELPLREAKAYCTTYTAGIPERLEWLRSTLRTTGGPIDAMEAGREGLGALWPWLVDQIDHPGGGSPPPVRPPWHSQDATNPYLSDRTLWLIDAIGCHLAEIVRAVVPDARWDVYRVGARFKDVDQHRTMLHGLPGRPADTVQMVYGRVIGMVLHGKPYKPDALEGLYDYLLGQG